MLKLKNGNDFGAKKKNEHIYTKKNKTPRLNVFKHNIVKHKLLRHVPFKNQVEPLPTTTEICEIKRKHYVKKFKSETTKQECIVKFLELLHKLDKLLHNRKFIKSKMTMEILHAKSNMRLIILHIKGVIIIPDPNTMKSNATTS